MKNKFVCQEIYTHDHNLKINDSAVNTMKEAVLENYPLGTVSGYYDDDLTIWNFSEYFLKNLGYSSYQDFMDNTDGLFSKVICEDYVHHFSYEQFKNNNGEFSFYLLTKQGSPMLCKIIKKEAYDNDNRLIWIISVRVNHEVQHLLLANDIVESGLWYIDYDVDGKIINATWGKHLRKMLGFDHIFNHQEMIEICKERIFEEDLKKLFQLFHDAPFNGTDIYQTELRIKDSLDKYHWFRVNAKKVRRSNGTVCQLIGVIVNIDKRKLARNELIKGMTKIVDRFAICDLKEDSYEYYEIKENNLYPAFGRYYDFISDMNEICYVFNNDNKSIIDLLNINSLKEILIDDNDYLKFEYCNKVNSEFKTMSVIPLQWNNNIVSKVILIAQDSGKKHELERIANTDSLTGLYNYRYFTTIMTKLEEKKQVFAIFYLDLDLFKPVNDTYGHDIGDKVLKEVSKRLKDCLNSNDYIFRIGGDEFVLIIEDNDINNKKCEEIVSIIKDNISKTYFIDEIPINISVSCGYAMYPKDSHMISEVRNLADYHMYRDKAKK